MAATVPAVIYSIPPSSPLHYVTYVRIYSSTSSTVLVGYTPGYYGTVMTTDGTVVYGTGYVYPVYVGTVWYPPPPTYGWGVVYWDSLRHALHRVDAPSAREITARSVTWTPSGTSTTSCT